jgi:hypothetical protein
MKLYLSGPMTGLPDDNFPAFQKAAAALRAMGHEVVNPAELVVDTPRESPEFWSACLRADLKAMLDCDGIALLQGWWASKGANLELHVAHRVNMQVLFVPELLQKRRYYDQVQAAAAEGVAQGQAS